MLASEAVAVVDDNRRYLAVSDPAVALIGARARGVLRSRLDDSVPPEHRSALERLWIEFRKHGTFNGQVEIVGPDGQRRAVELRGTWNFGVGQHLIVARTAGRPAGPCDTRPTARECEVLQLAAEGMTTSEIAARLVISHGTVKTHFENVYPKLGARDRASAVVEALRRHLIR
jgi:DNA-binding CsgD family transcriptional regulator